MNYLNCLRRRSGRRTQRRLQPQPQSLQPPARAQALPLLQEARRLGTRLWPLRWALSAAALLPVRAWRWKLPKGGSPVASEPTAAASPPALGHAAA